MILKSLRFERGYRCGDGLAPLEGAAVFETKDSNIALKLTDEQAKRILDICADALHLEMIKSLSAMKSALTITLEKRKGEGDGIMGIFD